MDEVTEAIITAAGHHTEEVSVVSLRKVYGGTQVAVALVPQTVSGDLIERGRIKIGMVYCRIRKCVRRIRCYRCLGYGHEAKNCKGTDRRNCCTKCGQVDLTCCLPIIQRGST